MKRSFYIFFAFVFGLSTYSVSWGANPSPFPPNVTFTTRALTPFAIEGLTMDATGNFYTTGRQPDTAKKCPVWRINPANGSRVTVGFIQNSPACNPSGITFNSIGDLFIADAASGGIVWKVTPDPNGCASDDSTNPACSTIPNGTAFATGVPGTNGLAFDKNGNLWTGDGTTGQGRVWKITGSGANCAPASLVNCEEVFRIQPMRNSTSLGGDLAGDGVGRQARTYPPGTNSTTVNNPVTPPPPPLPAGVTLNATGTQVTFTPQGGQDLVANGVAFNRAGVLFVLDTARGAIWKAEFDSAGNLTSKTNCDTTFTANTLCLENVLVAHPLLEGADGFVLDQAGNFWVDANERNAVVVFATTGQVIEIFRSPLDPATQLRNTGPLEFPTSPFISGKTLCTSNSDGNRRDNSPNTAGEITPAGPNRGKISCMDQDLNIPGMPLPVQ